MCMKIAGMCKLKVKKNVGFILATGESESHQQACVLVLCIQALLRCGRLLERTADCMTVVGGHGMYSGL